LKVLPDRREKRGKRKTKKKCITTFEIEWGKKKKIWNFSLAPAPHEERSNISTSD
jgi:hypothetical protein